MGKKNELQKQHEAIGKLVVAFSQVDVQLNQSIGWLINPDISVGQIVTSFLYSFDARLKLFFSLYKHRASTMDWFLPQIKGTDFNHRNQLVERAKHLENRGRNINRIRNKVIHSIWFQQQRHLDEFGSNAPVTGLKIKTDNSASISGGKTGLQYEAISFSSKELEEFAEKTEAYWKDLVELIEDTKALSERYQQSTKS